MCLPRRRDRSARGRRGGRVGQPGTRRLGRGRDSRWSPWKRRQHPARHRLQDGVPCRLPTRVPGSARRRLPEVVAVRPLERRLRRGVGHLLLVPDGTVRVTAHFVPASGQDVEGAIKTLYTLKVTATGLGTVRSSPGGIDFSATSRRKCTMTYGNGKTVTLRATPASGRTTMWHGGVFAVCQNTECKVRMEASAHITAAFAKPRRR